MGRDAEKILPTKDPLATAVLMLLVGLVMAVTGMGAITILVVFAGVMLMIYGARYISRGARGRSIADLLLGLLGAMVGLLLAIYTGGMMSIMIVLVALFLIVLGVIAIISNMGAGSRRRTAALAVDVLMIAIGLFLILYPEGLTDLMVTIIGIVIIVVSALSIYTYIR